MLLLTKFRDGKFVDRLIAFLDAFLIALITWHVRAIFGMLIRAKGEFWLVSV